MADEQRHVWPGNLTTNCVCAQKCFDGATRHQGAIPVAKITDFGLAIEVFV